MSVTTEAVAMQCGYKQGYLDGEIAILEILKEDIKEWCEGYLAVPSPDAVGRDISDYLIDNHLKRLKKIQDGEVTYD